MAGNLLNMGYAADQQFTIYKHDGFTTDILDSYLRAMTNEEMGLSWDGANVLQANYTTDLIYVMTGFSATVESSFAAVEASDLAYDGTNVIMSDHTTITRFVGKSASIDATFTPQNSGSARGVAWDGTNAMTSYYGSGGAGQGRCYLYVGFSDTLDQTLDGSYGAWEPTQCGWDSDNLIVALPTTGVARKYSGFSTTVLGNVTFGAVGTRGIADDSWGGDIPPNTVLNMGGLFGAGGIIDG